nr:PREDICTED: WD repeat-containing protein 38 [Apteryx mantelli mantelli]
MVGPLSCLVGVTGRTEPGSPESKDQRRQAQAASREVLPSGRGAALEQGPTEVIKSPSLELGHMLRVFSGHRDAIQTCDFSLDAHCLAIRLQFPFPPPHLLMNEWHATGFWDHTVRVWDLQSDIQDRILEGHRGNVTCVCFSVLGMLASGSWDRSVWIWDPRSGMLVFLLKGHVCWVKCMSFSGNGLLLATAGYSETLLYLHQSGTQGINNSYQESCGMKSPLFTASNTLLFSTSNIPDSSPRQTKPLHLQLRLQQALQPPLGAAPGSSDQISNQSSAKCLPHARWFNQTNHYTYGIYPSS